MNDGLADVDRRVVGTKQVLRALDEGKVAHAYVAQDADLLLTKRVVDRCYDMDIPCTQVESMEKLGRAMWHRRQGCGRRSAQIRANRPQKNTGCYAARRRFVCYDPAQAGSYR